MATVQRVYPSDFDEIHRVLLRQLNPGVEREDWRQLFTYSWDRSEDYVGYSAMENGKPVAFIGLIFSETRVGCEREKCCNVTSLIADDGHRATAAALVLAVRNLKEHTVTNLTCNEEAYNVFARMGFQVLETHFRIVPPSFGSLFMWGRRGCKTTFDTAEIEPIVGDRDRKILRDHLPYTEHMLTWDDSGYSYVVYTTGARWGLETARVHYLSDPKRFAAHLPRIQHSLMRRHGTLLLECDERFLNGMRIPLSFTKRLPIPRLFRSPRLSSGEITNLYSELVILRL